MNYKTWLDNEYTLWAEALKESTVHNFREHPQVKRMLGEIDPYSYYSGEISQAINIYWVPLLEIQNIGYSTPLNYVIPKIWFSGAFRRMIYWALKVLENNPKSICEIGGGVGEFYAILRALGYKGSYYIHDLKDVKEFQKKFIAEAERLTGIDMSFKFLSEPFCVSFYALGEFDDDLKQSYIEQVVNNCEHGLIIWNPHSGASEEINIDHKITVENQHDGTLKITW